MKIIHVLTRLLRAGSEENTIASALWQVEAGHKVTIAHGPDPDPYWRDRYGSKLDFVEVPDLVHPIHPIRDTRALLSLRKLYRGLKPDVIHTHQSKAGVLGRLAASATPCALVVHGIHIIPFAGVGALKKWIYIGAEKMAARQTDQFIAVSKSVGQAYVDAGICEAFMPVYSGMDLRPFQTAVPPTDSKKLIGTQADDPGRPKVVLMLAAFEERKRHIPFLKSLAKHKRDLGSTRVLFAGKGPFEPDVRQAVKDLGLEDIIVFCGFRDDPQALIALSDVCILTSEREGLPRVVVQYLAGGKPVIVNDLPGIDEVMSDQINGLITASDDLDDTILALKRLLNNPEELETLTQGARTTDVSAWTLDQLGSKTTDLYVAGVSSLPARRRSSSATNTLRPTAGS